MNERPCRNCLEPLEMHSYKRFCPILAWERIMRKVVTMAPDQETYEPMDNLEWLEYKNEQKQTM